MPDDLPSATIDRDRPAQALGNLLSNATKYTPRGGTVSVRAGADADELWIEVSDTGIGFAVPSAIVIKVVPELIDRGAYQSAWLGISGLTLTSELAEAMHLDPDTRGALVSGVAQGGPADAAGLRGGNTVIAVSGVDIAIGGDVIVAIDDTEITDFAGLATYLARYTPPGQKVTVTVLRDARTVDIEITVGSRPSQPPSSALQIEG